MDKQTFIRSYQIAPIILVGGIAAGLDNGQMTVLTLTEGSDTVNLPSESDYFANFKVIPGGTLVDFSPAEYPFASMSMAANAVLQNVLRISVEMICPARNEGNTYAGLQATLTRLQQQLTAHILAGGTFTVGTPGYIYSNCLLLALRDTTNAGDKKVQQKFQWDFVQPLITQQAATQTFAGLYAKIAGGLPVPNPPMNSGPGAAIGNAQNNQPLTSVQTAGTGPSD